MTEQEYITATNLAKIIVITTTLCDVMDGDKYGVNKDDYATAVTCLHNIKSVLFKAASIDS